MPGPTGVTGTFTLVMLAMNVAVAGTVATAVLLELKLTVSPPAGAGDDRLRNICCVPLPVMVRVPGEKTIVSAANTVWVDAG